MERLKCNLTFRELRKDENLYDDVDLTAGSMVDAQYRRVAGYEDNPDVCALPKMPSVRDILALGMVNLMLAYKQDQSKRENLHQWYNRKRMIQRQRKAKENGK